MPAVFWAGKLSWPMKLLMNANCALAWVVGNTRDEDGMKRRVKAGYEGEVTDHVARYDELGLDHYERAAKHLLDGLDPTGRLVLDVGCGTGVVSLQVLRQGAARVVAGDFSEAALRSVRAKLSRTKLPSASVFLARLDAEKLPFQDESFDAVVSGLVLGFLPNQEKAVAEMARVVRPGGAVAITTHGPSHYWEGADATLRAISKRYVLGYRMEMWFRSQEEVSRILEKAGLKDVRAETICWKHQFRSGEDAYDFFSATTSSWWFAKVPEKARSKESDRMRDYFGLRSIDAITSEIVLARGTRV